MKECYSCPYARWISIEDATEPKLECDPPMGECPAEQPKPMGARDRARLEREENK